MAEPYDPRARYVNTVTYRHVLKHKERASEDLSVLYRHGHTPQPNNNNTPSEDQSTDSDSSSTVSHDALTWPPDGLHARSRLAPEDAETLIVPGALVFESYITQAAYMDERKKWYFAFADTAKAQNDPNFAAVDPSFSAQSLVLGSYDVDNDRPWETLEQPSMALCFTNTPGTITLNRYVTSITGPVIVDPPISSIVCRDMALRKILRRLHYLQSGLEEDPMDGQEYLYNQLICDHDAVISQPPDIERQIFALAEALNSLRWFDFRKSECQTVASFFHSDKEVYPCVFFHQLLLSMQLLLNIEESDLSDDHKLWIYDRLPERVAWSVAMAQLWRDNCAIDRLSHQESDPILGPYRICFLNFPTQLEILRKFAVDLKWPRMRNVEETLQEQCHPLEERSFEFMTLLSGLVLPGNYLSWILMGSLMDCDSEASNLRKDFVPFLPNSGFQYEGSSYWYWECIMAKVMAGLEGVNQVSGWVGPVPYTSDLAWNRFVAVNQYPAPRYIEKHNIKSMDLRSDPLGPEEDDYPVRSFGFPTIKTDATNSIHFQHIELKPAKLGSLVEGVVWDSCVVFALDTYFKPTVPVRLRYNVSFIGAPPCKSGPHVLHYSYAPTIVRVDFLWRLNFWAGCCVCPLDKKGDKCKHRAKCPKKFDEEKVLVVKAFGRADNDVFARAWCSYVGLSAVIACRNTCAACAVRMAVAARVFVVILTDGKKDENGEDVKGSESSSKGTTERH